MGDKSPSAGASGVEGRNKPLTDSGPTNVTSRYGTDSGRTVEQVKEKVVELFGRELTTREYGLLVGAQDNSDILVEVSTLNQLRIRVSSDNIKEQERYIRKTAQGDLFIENFVFKTSGNAPPGYGTKVLTDQVKGARELGIKTITTRAVGDINTKDWNGYTTWPRLGYDGKLSGTTEYYLPEPIRKTMNSMTIQELYKTKEGRDWWKQNGGEIKLTFDTDPGSLSSRVLDNYNEERAKRKKG